MRLITAVYAALRSFPRPATRRELEKESGLDQAGVRKGLAGLERRGVLIMDGGQGRLTTYKLRPGAEPPKELRGGQRERKA